MIPVAAFCLSVPFLLAMAKNALVQKFEDKYKDLSKYLIKTKLPLKYFGAAFLFFSIIMTVVVGPFGIPSLFNVVGPFFCGEGYQNVAADVSARWFDIGLGLFSLTLTQAKVYCTGEMGEFFPPDLLYYGILTVVFSLLFTVLFVILVYIDKALRRLRRINTKLRYAAGILVTAGFWTFFLTTPVVFRPIATPVSEFVATSRFGPLSHSVFHDNIKMVKLLLKKGADPNMKTLWGDTLLTAAAGQNNARKNNIEMFRLLLERGADPNLHGDALLASAVYQNNIELTRLLLENGADPNIGYKYGSIPLLKAVEQRGIGIIKVLLKSGADVNVTDKTGKTPLMAAASRGKENDKDIVELLVKNGANLKAKDKNGKTVMDWAGGSDMVHLLLRLGTGEGGEPPEKIKLREKGMTVSLADLVRSIRKNDLESVMLLIEAGVDLRQTEGGGLARYNTPLIEAVERGTPGIVEILLEKGADVNAHSYYGYIPLVQAVGRRSSRIVEILLKNRADVNAIDVHGNSALIKAAKAGDGEVVKLLLDNGADVNYRDNEDNTALTYAIKKGHGVIVNLLLERGAESD